MTSLEQVNGSHAQFEEPNFLTATLVELIDHIVEKHHVFTKTELARLHALMDKVHGAHGQNHPEIAELRDLFKALGDELGPHMDERGERSVSIYDPNGGSTPAHSFGEQHSVSEGCGDGGRCRQLAA